MQDLSANAVAERQRQICVSTSRRTSYPLTASEMPALSVDILIKQLLATISRQPPAPFINRRLLDCLVEGLIEFLDALDPDSDREPDYDGEESDEGEMENWPEWRPRSDYRGMSFGESPAAPGPRSMSETLSEVGGMAGVLAAGDARRAPVPDFAMLRCLGVASDEDASFVRLVEVGGDRLTDVELLETLLLFAQTSPESGKVAQNLTHALGGFASVLSATPRDLLKVPGTNRRTVAAIKLVQVGAQRLVRADIVDRPVLNNWEKLLNYLHVALAREKIEQFRVLFLDRKNRLIVDEELSRGTVAYTPVYPREVMIRALDVHASAIILAHNHPSGDPVPSVDDIDMTKEVRRAAEALSIVLHDHIIIGNGSWVSLRQEGLL